MIEPRNIDALAAELKERAEPFAVATVVRTVASVAAKPGAKAIIAADGRIFGWIGGGCALAAVKKAAVKALADGQARLISVMPFDQLKAQGLRPGEARDGVEFAKNMCPSRGVVDVFIEPMLPKPKLFLCGSTPVAMAIAELAPRIGLDVSVHVQSGDQGVYPNGVPVSEGFEELALATATALIVVATQGAGDEAALRASLASQAKYIAFVGSRRKVAALKEQLAGFGVTAARLAELRGPAGVAIGAVTPEEIALSILADVIKARRQDFASMGNGKLVVVG